MNRKLMLAAILLVAVSAMADTTYSDQPSFLGAVGSTTTVTFTGMQPAGGFTFYPGTVTVNGVTFTADGGNSLSTVDQGYYSGYSLQGSDSSIISFGGNGALTMYMPTGTYGVGFSYDSFFSGGITVTLSNGNVFFIPAGGACCNPGGSYFGVTSPNSIASLRLDPDNSGDAMVGQVDYHAVPEPASMTLLGTSLAGAAFRRFRRKK